MTALTIEKQDEETKKEYKTQMRPLLSVCDELRDDLQLAGVQIQVN